MKEDQITHHLLMVRPAHFGYNHETAENNAFQSENPDLTPEQVQAKAVREFDEFVSRLRQAGVNVHVADDTASPLKPDAVFPNNWVTFHQDGTVATYPMHAPTRRHERREEILDSLANRFEVHQRIRFEDAESEQLFLEGTGSLILDRPNRIAYACLSPRTDERVLDRFCERMGYKQMAFTALDPKGQPIYHTNVMMALGLDFVVICLEAVPDQREREQLLSHFKATHKAVIEITMQQMLAFAGNMLQVRNQAGEPYVVMSEQAYESLRPEQVRQLEAHTKVLHSPLYTIEQHGGGSARCMMAEIFLKEK